MVSQSIRKKSFLVMIITVIIVCFSGLFSMEANAGSVSKGDVVVNYAKKINGVPFKYGGTSPKGFDASGYTQYVFSKSVKVKIPRTSADQYKVGKSVKLNNLKYGDLVFYKTNGKTVSFVGIYIGNKKFISATSKGVRVQSMEMSYWKNIYVGAKRIVQ
ncbi:cell wall-associated NlpC family hydrolase [Salirhabdus euzebyi]|uniref:Cell wall-associated NlpC family hydrolase n=1 Tax=Salirhabdus euzebyi TaxID=394506 RepID=A0A841Q7D9_9BACI|nr:C40 family peptidase [Salirhabdus euzebyi]MBB6454479.1 cell wall-associated NlpC family hydrolase [Salirhabdus euzebyi]